MKYTEQISEAERIARERVIRNLWTSSLDVPDQFFAVTFRQCACELLKVDLGHFAAELFQFFRDAELVYHHENGVRLEVLRLQYFAGIAFEARLLEKKLLAEITGLRTDLQMAKRELKKLEGVN